MKKWAKILCFLFVMGLGLTTVLAGCATVSKIENSNDELLYNGTSAVMVDGYLYYGNAYADYTEFSTVSDYKTSAKISYLARLDTSSVNATSGDYSPDSVEEVSQEVVGSDSSFMFVLGDYIYYATPNTQKATDSSGSTSQYFNYTTIYRSKLNGNSKKKLYTTNGEISQIEVLKADDTYYIVMLAGTSLVKINLSTNKAEEIATSVTSVAMPKTYQSNKIGSTLDFNGYIYYTIEREDENSSELSGNIVYRIALSGGDAEKAYTYNNSTITLLGREKDVIFFAETLNGTTEVYTVDVSDDVSLSNSTKSRFFSVSSISDINLISSDARDLGYIYTANSALRYTSLDGTKSGIITLTVDDEELSSYSIMFVNGRTVYLSTDTGIYKADISSLFYGSGGNVTIECSTLVTMTAILSGTLYAYDGTYIYFYAQLEDLEDEDEEDDDDDEDEDDEDEETDEYYYLYRVNTTNTSGEYQLLGLTSISSRHTTD